MPFRFQLDVAATSPAEVVAAVLVAIAERLGAEGDYSGLVVPVSESAPKRPTPSATSGQLTGRLPASRSAQRPCAEP